MKCPIAFAHARLRHTSLCAFVIMFMMSSVSAVRATCPPEVPPASLVLDESSKDYAQQLYNRGAQLLLHEPIDYAEALKWFMISRDLYPSPDNSLMAAMCLRHMGSYPEALALYEEILTRFDQKLKPHEKDEFQRYVRELRKKVVIADIVEKKGTFSIDDESCGPLPRAEPVYLMPGSHVLHVRRPLQPESLSEFSGAAGTRISVQLVKPPDATHKPPDLHGWFLHGAVGPAIAWSGIGKFAVGDLEQSTGFIAQGYGGYRLPNGIMVALNIGMLNLTASSLVEKPFGSLKYKGNYEWLFRSSFGGLSAGWGTPVNQRFDIWFRGGFGLMGTRSQHIFKDGCIYSGGIGGSEEKELPVDITGTQVIQSVPQYSSSVPDPPTPVNGYSIPGYATVEAGGAVRVGPFRVGFTIGGLFILDQGPPLPTLYVSPQNADSATCVPGASFDTFGPKDAPCLPRLRFGQQAYRPAFILLPQLVIGF